jgi:hypothetical protein
MFLCLLWMSLHLSVLQTSYADVVCCANFTCFDASMPSYVMIVVNEQLVFIGGQRLVHVHA